MFHIVGPKDLIELKALVWLLGVALIFLAFVLLVVFAPALVTPFAKLWYEPGFEDSVAEAMQAMPESEGACIYDDTRGVFVTSIQQLDVGRMIEKAVRNRFPIPRNPSIIDPHFRIYSGGQTYYWSFKEREFKSFNRSGFSLVDDGTSLCEAYRSNPDLFESVFNESARLPVTEDNFCCISESPPQL